MSKFNQLNTLTIREFNGGLNVVQDDLNMSTAYSKIETNVYNSLNGGKAKRYGTKFFTKLETDQSLSEERPFDCIVVRKNVSDVGEFRVGIGSYSINARQTITVHKQFVGVPIKIIIKDYTTKQTVFTLDSFVSDYNEEQDYYAIPYSTELDSYFQGWHNNTNTLGFDYDFYVGFSSNVTANHIVNITYFNDYLILVTNTGEIVAIDGSGFQRVIWNNAISQHLNGTNGWSTATSSVCFAVFNGKLTVWNGKDKPLVIDFNEKVVCNYLFDPATGSNGAIPIAKYALAMNHYLVLANIFNTESGKFESDKISISAFDNMYTYTGSPDADFYDPVDIYLSTVVNTQSKEIKGLARYRDKLIVGFEDLSVIGIIGERIEEEKQTDNNETYKVLRHNPKFEDIIDNTGCISNRTYAPINNELVCLDYAGVPIIKRTGLQTQITPQKISKNISPEMTKVLGNLTESMIEDNIFGLINPKDNQYMIFMPDEVSYELEDNRYPSTKYYTKDYSNFYVYYWRKEESVFYTDKECTHLADKQAISQQGSISMYYTGKQFQLESACFVYTMPNLASASPLTGAWSKFTGWNFRCGVTTVLNNTFLCEGLKVFLLGNIDNPYYADFIDDPDKLEQDPEYDGTSIHFDWEFPWADFGNRAATKHMRYVSISSTGTAEFNLDTFLDYIYTDRVTGNLDPQLSISFVGGDSVGYGNGKQNYGGGRITNNELMFAYPAKFKIAKLKIHGSSKEKLNINSLTIYYQQGNIRR